MIKGMFLFSFLAAFEVIAMESEIFSAKRYDLDDGVCITYAYTHVLFNRGDVVRMSWEKDAGDFEYESMAKKADEIAIPADTLLENADNGISDMSVIRIDGALTGGVLLLAQYVNLTRKRGETIECYPWRRVCSDLKDCFLNYFAAHEEVHITYDKVLELINAKVESFPEGSLLAGGVYEKQFSWVYCSYDKYKWGANLLKELSTPML